jgi:hypothetical protein
MNGLDTVTSQLLRTRRRVRIYPVRQPCEDTMTRCIPELAACPQEPQCARARVTRLDARNIDASICLGAGTCPMFIDSRAVALLS